MWLQTYCCLRTSTCHLVGSFRKVQVQCCRFTSTETIRTIRDGESRTATSTFTKPLSSDISLSFVQCCFSSTKTIRTIRDGEPRTSTSTFTKPLSSDISLSFVQCCFSSTKTIRTIRDGEPRTSTSTFTQLLGSDFRNLWRSLLWQWLEKGYRNPMLEVWLVGIFL